MLKQTRNVTLVTHAINGNIEEEVKFVEVEGKKFVDDGSGKPKVGDDGQPIAFVEKKGNDTDPASQSLEELAKTNPAIARILEEKKVADQKIADAEKAEAERKRQEAEKNGEWQKLADERQAEIDRLTSDIAKKDSMLGKYKGSVESILKEVLATIPKDKQSLIPADYSPRQKLEYITKNAKVLGAKGVNAGEKIEGSDKQPDLNEKEKLTNRLKELLGKKDKTPEEQRELSKVATDLKKIQTDEAAAKKS